MKNTVKSITALLEKELTIAETMLIYTQDMKMQIQEEVYQGKVDMLNSILNKIKKAA